MRIMGIDYGDSRVGIALSDPMGFMAQGYGTLPNKVFPKLLDSVCDIINRNGVKKVVIGLPKNMNGTLGSRAEITREFADSLHERISNVEIVFQDERLTTVSAQKSMIASNMNRKKRHQMVDTMAAVIILQSYLDSLK